MEELAQAVNRIIDFYLERGCPCRFPRFREIVRFDFFTYKNLSPHTTHETDLLLQRCLRAEAAVYIPQEEWEGNSRRHACTVCGSAALQTYDDFSINFGREFLIIGHPPEDLGAAAVLPMPLYWGPYGVNHPGDNEILNTLFTQVNTVAAFEEHMTALPAEQGRNE